MIRRRRVAADVRRIAAAIVIVALTAACASPTQSEVDAVGSSSARPSEGGEVTDLVECRQVPEVLCDRVVLSTVRGVQPDYAEGAQIERVIVTCEVNPPCGEARLDSGGKILILYTNGWAWTQDWAPGSGI